MFHVYVVLYVCVGWSIMQCPWSRHIHTLCVSYLAEAVRSISKQVPTCAVLFDGCSRPGKPWQVYSIVRDRCTVSLACDRCYMHGVRFVFGRWQRAKVSRHAFFTHYLGTGSFVQLTRGRCTLLLDDVLCICFLLFVVCLGVTGRVALIQRGNRVVQVRVVLPFVYSVILVLPINLSLLTYLMGGQVPYKSS